jgi:formate-dependent nitrite reductase membrane component NrfD
MDTDLVLTLGIVIFALTLPSLLAAWVEGRVPRIGAILVIASLGMILGAVAYRPGGYAFNDIPGIMLAVGARLIN